MIVMYGMNGMGWGMGFGWIVGILIFALFIWIIAKNRGINPDFRQNDKSALEILKERYAKGEITKEEFEEKKKDIIN